MVWLLGLLLIIICISSHAAENEVSLTVHYEYEGNQIQDMAYELFYVASMSENNHFELEGEFTKYPIELNGLDTDGWRSMASMLNNYVKRDKIMPIDISQTDEQGNALFPKTKDSLPQGLYLVSGTQLVVGNYVYYSDPSLMSLSDFTSLELTVLAKGNREEMENHPMENVTERKVIKIWKEDEEAFRPRQVSIQLLQNGALFDEIILKKDNNWQYRWKELPAYDERGILIDWGILERDTENYTISISQNENTFLVTNTYTPALNIEGTESKTLYKVWDDKGYEKKRPKQITVHLLQSGTKYDTKILNAEMGWKYIWKDIPVKDDDGQVIKWTIQEEAVMGYKAKVEEKGNNYVLTNTVVKDSLPQTGLLWWPVLVLISAGLFFMVLGKWIKNRA